MQVGCRQESNYFFVFTSNMGKDSKTIMLQKGGLIKWKSLV